MATLTVLHGSRHFRVDHIIKPRPPVADVEYIKESQSINVSLNQHVYMYVFCYYVHVQWNLSNQDTLR